MLTSWSVLAAAMLSSWELSSTSCLSEATLDLLVVCATRSSWTCSINAVMASCVCVCVCVCMCVHVCVCVCVEK